MRLDGRRRKTLDAILCISTLTPSHQNLTYREMLSSGQFFYGAEVVTTRGLEPVDSPGNLASFAKDLLADPRIGWISITDNPGGGPMLPPDWLARPGGRASELASSCI